MEDLLQQGITAYRAGKRDEARKFFTTLVKQNPDSERAWEWMYNVCSTDNERIHCLKQIIRINPKNEKANQLFAKFTKTDFSTKSAPIIKQSSPRPAQTAKSKSTNEIQKPLDPQKQKNLQIGITATIFLCVIFICLAVFNSSSGGDGNPTPTAPAITLSTPTLIVVPLPPSGGSGGACCKVCGANSKPCGDSCISNSYSCNKPPGCACDG